MLPVPSRMKGGVLPTDERDDGQEHCRNDSATDRVLGLLSAVCDAAQFCGQSRPGETDHSTRDSDGCRDCSAVQSDKTALWLSDVADVRKKTCEFHLPVTWMCLPTVKALQ